MRWGRLATENHRGVLMPRTLGFVLAATVALWGVVDGWLREVPDTAWIVLLGALLVFAAGLVDDVVSSGPRGLRGHLRQLANGHVTTGALKIVVTVGAAIIVVTSARLDRWWAASAAVVLVAGAANVWNGLDVRPGRALKAYLPLALPFLLAGDPAQAPALLGLFVGALLVLPLDLRERAMLGDAGANLLGFGVGVGLFLVLPAWAIVASAVVAVALNVVAETVSFSRVIDGVLPLRWLDRLGRVEPVER